MESRPRASRVLLWSRLNKEATLVTTSTLFLFTKKKKKKCFVLLFFYFIKWFNLDIALGLEFPWAAPA